MEVKGGSSMALEASILNGTKKKLGLDAGYAAFDTDVIDYINGAFFRLRTLGLGPPEGFQIEGDTETWEDFNTVELNKTVVNAVKTYIQRKVRLQFDPPDTPHHIKALEDQIREDEHVLLTERELLAWQTQPSLPSLP
jgi:hypothetical protein